MGGLPWAGRQSSTFSNLLDYSTPPWIAEPVSLPRPQSVDAMFYRLAADLCVAAGRGPNHAPAAGIA